MKKFLVATVVALALLIPVSQAATKKTVAPQQANGFQALRVQMESGQTKYFSQALLNGENSNFAPQPFNKGKSGLLEYKDFLVFNFYDKSEYVREDFGYGNILIFRIYESGVRQRIGYYSAKMDRVKGRIIFLQNESAEETGDLMEIRSGTFLENLFILGFKEPDDSKFIALPKMPKPMTEPPPTRTEIVSALTNNRNTIRTQEYSGYVYAIDPIRRTKDIITVVAKDEEIIFSANLLCNKKQFQVISIRKIADLLYPNNTDITGLFDLSPEGKAEAAHPTSLRAFMLNDFCSR